MKNALIFVLFISSCLFTLSGNEIFIENPSFIYSSHSNVIINAVECNDTAMILDMTVFHSPHHWIRIASDTYIRVNGQKKYVKSAGGIELDKETFARPEGKSVFTLHFPPIDKDTKEFDFIESDCDNCFKIWGINLNPAAERYPSEIPQKIKDAAEIKEDGKSLSPPLLKQGKATFKGQFAGFLPEMNRKIAIYVNNPLAGSMNMQSETEIRIKDDGTFETEIPLITTMQVFFRSYYYSGCILLSPDKETNIYVDLLQKSCQETSNEAQRCSPRKYIYFGGANAEINNQAEDLKIRDELQAIFYEDQDHKAISEMSAEQYRSDISRKVNTAEEMLRKKGLTKKAYELALTDLRLIAADKLTSADWVIENAFRKANNLNYEDKLEGFKKPSFDKNFYSLLKDLRVNEPNSLYSNHLAILLNYLDYIGSKNIDRKAVSEEVYSELIDSGNLSPEDIEITRLILQEKNENDPTSSFGKEDSLRIKNFTEKYINEIRTGFEKKISEKTNVFLSEILGTSEGVLFDLLTVQSYCRKFDSYLPLTETELNKIAQLKDPFYFDYVKTKNNELIEANKNKKPYTIYDTPETENDLLFAEIIKPFAGKAVLVNFWATWCGPCRLSIRQFEPAKDQFKGKDVVFVYLTDETSPKSDWENMIPRISGEHFRLKEDQFSYLKKKFGASGIPSYLILDKKGEQVYFTVGFEGTESISNKLTAESEKN